MVIGLDREKTELSVSDIHSVAPREWHQFDDRSTAQWIMFCLGFLLVDPRLSTECGL